MESRPSRWFVGPESKMGLHLFDHGGPGSSTSPPSDPGRGWDSANR